MPVFALGSLLDGALFFLVRNCERVVIHPSADTTRIALGYTMLERKLGREGKAVLLTVIAI